MTVTAAVRTAETPGVWYWIGLPDELIQWLIQVTLGTFPGTEQIKIEVSL